MKIMNKKGMESSTVIVIIVSIVILAIILMLIYFFGSTTGESEIFKRSTDWSSGFSW